MSEDLGLAGELRRAREARGESLEQIHQRTGIGLRLLQGLEQGNYRVVEPIYTRLALVHYALHLGLDGDALTRRFDAESGASGPRPVLVRTPQPGAPAPLPPLSPLQELLTRQPPGRLVAVVAAIVALLAALLYLLGNREGVGRSSVDDGRPEAPLAVAPRPSAPASSASTGSARPGLGTATVAAESPRQAPATVAVAATADAAAGSPAQPPHASAAALEPGAATPAAAPAAVPPVALSSAPTAEPIRHAVPPTPETTIADAAMEGDAGPAPAASAPAAPAPAPATTPADAPAGEPAPTPAPAGADAQAAPAPTSPPGAVDLPPPTAGPGGLVMEARAVDSTWVQVQWDGAGGAVEIIPEGETRRWSAQGYFLVRSGRAHGVRFRFQGHDLGRLGDATKVLRFRASPEGIQLLGPDLEPIAPLAQIQPDTAESSAAGAR